MFPGAGSASLPGGPLRLTAHHPGAAGHRARRAAGSVIWATAGSHCLPFGGTVLWGSICERRSWLRDWISATFFFKFPGEWEESALASLGTLGASVHTDLGFCSRGDAGMFIDIKRIKNNTNLFYSHLSPLKNTLLALLRRNKTRGFPFILKHRIHCYSSIIDRGFLVLQKVSLIIVLLQFYLTDFNLSCLALKYFHF